MNIKASSKVPFHKIWNTSKRNHTGSGINMSKMMIYKADSPLSEQINEITNSKRFISIHITGNDERLRELLGELQFQLKKETSPNELARNMFWFNMPEYKELNNFNIPQLIVGFINEEDKKEFFERINVKITENTRFIHYPNPIEHPMKDYFYKITYTINPKYPVYIISKGRWKTRHTARALDNMKVPYKIVVEPQEYKEYAKFIDSKKILKTPENFSKQSKGSIPVRNFVFKHAVKSGAKKHWILDDNIDGFQRWNFNRKWDINSGVLFRLIEDYVERFTNIKQAGMNYAMFYPERQTRKPITFNTRIYSCILMDHSIKKFLKEIWRGRYNEDTDLSLRILKAGYSTALFNAFLCKKLATLTVKGGNTDSIYRTQRNIREKAESLKSQHPDVARVVRRYKRGVHHEVDYSAFKNNELGYKNPQIRKGNNEFNMKLTKI